MQTNCDIAFKEWAVVVEALGSGEQILILRKGGMRETSGQFHMDHTSFWLFPTQFHEAEQSVIPSKRPALRTIAAAASADFVDIEFFAVAEEIFHITDSEVLKRLQGRHIWAEHVLQERFAFGREPGLYALLCRVHRRPAPVRVPVRPEYGGCKSWLTLEQPLATANLAPVLSEVDFTAECNAISELVTDHALAHL